MKKIMFSTVLLFGFITQKSIAQSSTNANVYGATYYLGYSASNPGDLLFKTSGTQIMMLQNSTKFLGIGTTFTPSYLLDISGGDIDINTTTNGLRMGGTNGFWGI